MLTNFNVLVLKFRVILVFLIYNILEKNFQMKLFVNYVFILVQFKSCCTLFEQCGKVIELTRFQNIYVHAMKMCNHTDRTTM